MESNGKTPWLKHIVTFLLAILILIMTWQTWVAGQQSKQIDDMRVNIPKEYVSLDRYKTDMIRLEKVLDHMDEKLDIIIRGRP